MPLRNSLSNAHDKPGTLLFTSNYRQDFHSNSVQMQNQDMEYIVDFKLLVYNIYIFEETTKRKRIP